MLIRYSYSVCVDGGPRGRGAASQEKVGPRVLCTHHVFCVLVLKSGVRQLFFLRRRPVPAHLALDHPLANKREERKKEKEAEKERGGSTTSTPAAAGAGGGRRCSATGGMRGSARRSSKVAPGPLG